MGVRKSPFSISDFAQPVIGRYDVQDCGAKTFCVFNGATAFLREDPAAAIEVSEMMCEGKIESAGEEELVSRSVLEVERSRRVDLWDFPKGMKESELSEVLKPVKVSNEDHKCIHHCHHHHCVGCSGEASHVCVPCGHRICDECAKDVKTCPLCHTECRSVCQVYDSELCCICMDAPSTCVVTPCGHKCLCAECAAKVMDQEAKCPMCATAFQQIRLDWSEECKCESEFRVDMQKLSEAVEETLLFVLFCCLSATKHYEKA